MKATKLSQRGKNLIQKFEGLKLKPYKCPANIWTIGYGNTYYADGAKVKPTDNPITLEEANDLFEMLLVPYEKAVDSFCRDDINQNQFDALCSFAYNVGNNALKNSTLIKKVNKNPQDVTIRNEFMKWNKANDKVLKGLTNRRLAEATLYESK